MIFSNTQSQDIALNKPYILSTAPDYTYTAPSSDKTSLTDGISTNGYFWSKQTTVGWSHVPVTIIIDLGQSEPISTVTFNTVRREDQFVFFPKNIFIYISNDGQNYKYVGDAADTSINVPGPYLIQKLILSNINFTARYVRLSVIPHGTLLFCDEIEVLKGIGRPLPQVELIPTDKLKQADDSLKNIEFHKQNLAQLINELQIKSKSRSGKEDSKYSNLQRQLKSRDISGNELQSIRKKVEKAHAQNIKSISSSSYLIQMYNPWDTLSEFYEPTLVSENLKYSYYVPVNGVQYGSFILTNNSTTPKTFTFKVSNNSPYLQFDLFNVPYVPSINYTQTPDPLIEVKGEILVNSGSTQMFFFKISGLIDGTGKIKITMNSENKQRTIDINAQVFTLRDSSKVNHILNANLWAYFTRPMISDRKEEAAADLLAHHVNTIVIPPAVLPNFQTSDYLGFGNYLSNFKEVKNFLLFMNYGSVAIKNGYPKGQFLSLEWKSKFIDWYNKTTNYLRQHGFANSQIYLYPYDEIYGKDINDLKNLISWAKGAIEGIKFYATLANKAAIDTILPLVNIAQIQSTYSGLSDLPPHEAEVWIYSGSGPARALSPYRFYRLMAWEAFENDFTGIGFWNYADEGPDKQLSFITDALSNPTNSYSVIYDGYGTQIISSRRWEAFRLGIEDYSILKSYANKFGTSAAKQIANQVLSSYMNTDLADSLRNKMITKLIANE